MVPKVFASWLQLYKSYGSSVHNFGDSTIDASSINGSRSLMFGFKRVGLLFSA